MDLPRLDRFADTLVRSFRTGGVIGLVGTLGAGKTRLTQGIAVALGIDVAQVTSPTFTLVQSHRSPGRPTQVQGSGRQDDVDKPPAVLHHIDAYRIADHDEWFEAGLQEIIDRQGVDSSWVVIEWADRFADCLPPQTLWVRLSCPDRSAGGDPAPLRRVEVRGPDASIATLVKGWTG